MRKQQKILFALFFSFALVSQAQETKSMSLKDCIDYSLQNNPTGMVYSTQVSIAEQQNKEGLSGYLPQVNLTGTLDDNIKRQVTVIPAGAFSAEDLTVQFGNQYNSSLSAQLDQVIYDQSLINSIKASKMNVELAGLKLNQNENSIIYNTASAYYQVLIYQEQLRLIKENELKIEQLVQVQELQYQKGVLNETSYKRVLVNYNNIKSQREMTETNVKTAMYNLKNAMGMELNAEIQISSTIDFENDVPKPVIESFDITQKADYLILEKNILLQEIDLRRKKAQAIPTISAYARYGANAFGNEFRTTFDNWYDFSSIGLKLNVPIFSGLRRVSQIKQSELNLEITRQNLLINSRSYELQLQNSQAKLSTSYLTLQSNLDNLTLANEVYEMTALQYQSGTVGLSDFLNADYSKKEAQSNYINSLLNYFIARIDIEQSKGTIKDFVNNL